MTGLTHELRHEWRLILRQGGVLSMLGVFAVLLAAAALNGSLLEKQRAGNSAAALAEATTLRDALQAQAARGVAAATSAGSVGYSVLQQPVALPRASLAALAIGQSDLLPGDYLITARGAHQFLSTVQIDNPLRLSVGGFDAAFVIVWLLPLVVIAVSFDLVSGDRERGVLALAVAQGAPLRRLMLRKFAMRVAVVAVPLVLATLLAAVVGQVPLQTFSGALLLGVWLCACLLYAAFWFALALFINSVPRASDHNAALLAGLWLLFVVVAPTLTNLVATAALPAPSRVALTTELREATEAADRAAAAARDQYFFDHPEMQNGDVDRTAYFQSVAVSERQVSAAMQPLLAAFDLQADRQRALVGTLQYLSPGTMTYQLLTSLGASDGSRHRSFRRQTLAYHQRWTAFFSTRLERNVLLTVADYAALPQFRFAERPVSVQLRDALGPLLTLASASLLLFLVALRRLRRYPAV